jgi:hypothetical protein
MNKKGFMFFTGIEVIPIIWMALVAVFSTHAISTRHDFQYKKALAKCEAEGLTTCGTIVDNMTKQERLEYIRDSFVPEKKNNGGNFK